MKTLTAPEIQQLRQQYGPNFYLLDLDHLLHNYRQLLQAGQAVYPEFAIAYSVKTNYTPAICRTLSRAGALLEVVSEMEYGLAQQLAHPLRKVVVNGPVHTQELMRECLLQGSIFHLDSLYQLDFLEQISLLHPDKLLEVGLRLNFETDTPSRFGLEATEAVLRPLLERLRKLPNVLLVALHSHYCEGARSVAAYRQRGEQLVKAHQQFFRGYPVRMLNAGGGFYSYMPPELAAQFSEPVPDPEDCIRALCEPVAAAYPQADRPLLLIEPGNALVADTMQFYCPVLELKELHGRQQLLVNGSIYDIKPTRNRKNLPLSFVSLHGQPSRPVHEADITGSTCMEEDVLYRGYSGKVAPGDYAVFSHTGAYTNVLRPPFIMPAPPIIAWQQGQFRLARGRETAEDLFRSYTF